MARRQAARRKKNAEQGRTFVTARLEMSPEEFGERQLKFARTLTRALDISRSDLDIVAYRAGCVDVDMLLPSPAAKALDDAAKQRKPAPDVLNEVLKEYRISKVSPRGAAFSEATIHLRSTGRSLSWLHLSDIHIKGGSSEVPDESLVRDEFIKQLPEALGDFDVDPDMVFVTGDVSQSADPTQFDEALKFFGSLRDALNKPELPILTVPGNHDVARAETNCGDGLSAEDRARAELVDHASVENLLRQPVNRDWRDALFRRLNNFNKFASDAAQFGQPQQNGDDFYYATMLERAKLKVGIAGLNSAWRSSHYPDRQRLMLSRWQMNSLEHALAGADLRIALVHHPAGSNDWFAHFDVAYQQLRLDRFDFILHGHEHSPRAETVVAGRRGAYHHIAAGALYTNDLGYTNSFNAVRVNLDSGDALAFFWRFGKDACVWVRDTEGFPREGFESFALSPTLKRRIGSKTGPITPLPSSPSL